LGTDRRLNDLVLVEADLGVILKADPNNYSANALLGSVRMNQKRYDEAEKALRKSIAVLPTAEALNDLAETLRIDRQFAEAEKMARHALRIAPNFHQAWDSLGCIMTDRASMKEAEAAFKCAWRFSEDPWTHLHHAKMSMRMDKKRSGQILKDLAPIVKNVDESFAHDYVVLSKEPTCHGTP
jgi:cytochrome c-type biogenesis protein CcmH/NrfG